MNNKFRVFLKGIFDVSPLMIPVVPFGLIFGVLSIDIGFSPIETMGMSLIVFFFNVIFNNHKIAWFFGTLFAAFNNYLGSKYISFKK